MGSHCADPACLGVADYPQHEMLVRTLSCVSRVMLTRRDVADKCEVLLLAEQWAAVADDAYSCRAYSCPALFGATKHTPVDGEVTPASPADAALHQPLVPMPRNADGKVAAGNGVAAARDTCNEEMLVIDRNHAEILQEMERPDIFGAMVELEEVEEHDALTGQNQPMLNPQQEAPQAFTTHDGPGSHPQPSDPGLVSMASSSRDGDGDDCSSLVSVGPLSAGGSADGETESLPHPHGPVPAAIPLFDRPVDGPVPAAIPLGPAPDPGCRAAVTEPAQMNFAHAQPGMSVELRGLPGG